MNPLGSRLELLARMGPGWVLWRAAYALRKGSGLLKGSLPAVPWDDVNLAGLRLGRRALRHATPPLIRSRTDRAARRIPSRARNTAVPHRSSCPARRK